MPGPAVPPELGISLNLVFVRGQFGKTSQLRSANNTGCLISNRPNIFLFTVPALAIQLLLDLSLEAIFKFRSSNAFQ